MHDKTDHYAVMHQAGSALVGSSSAKGFEALQTLDLQLCMHGKLKPICMGSTCMSGMVAACGKNSDYADSIPQQNDCCTAGSQLDETKDCPSTVIAQLLKCLCFCEASEPSGCVE